MPTQPNVLLICTDHWAAEHLGSGGNDGIITPGLNEISATGIRFSNAYSECPVCIPARRTLMTGQSPKTHGDRVFNASLPMPDVTTMAQAFRDGGYQADAVGKLHVHPQRSRIGFDNVISDTEGVYTDGLDDYTIYLGDVGCAGRQYDHGMSNNQYSWRPWHLDEQHHPTSWASRMMARTIKRRDPTKPAFWYLGFRHPHPPLVPPQSFMDLYNDVPMDDPYVGEWANSDDVPYAVGVTQKKAQSLYTKQQIMAAKKAFYALCTQIDYQIRYLIGTLRDEGILDDTIIVFTSDHGDMLGNHNMLEKRKFYQSSANIPMIISPNVNNKKMPKTGIVDERLVTFADIMPTVLDLCDVEIPSTVEGISMVGEKHHDYVYGECGEDDTATRMIRKGQYKLIYYPVGNHSQLFDVNNDPQERNDLSTQSDRADVLDELQNILMSELYGEDCDWIADGKLVGKPHRVATWHPHRCLERQRGDGWPPA